MAKRRKATDPPPDPAPELTEWNLHRYDPGYYLGGKLPPTVRWYQRAAGPIERSLIGMLLLFYVPVLPTIAILVPTPYNFLVAGVVTVCVVVGIYLAYRRRTPDPKATHARRRSGHRRDQRSETLEDT